MDNIVYVLNAFEILLSDPGWDLPAKLIRSMPDRLDAVRKAQGFQTNIK